MRYNAILTRKYKFAPVDTELDMEIPDDLNDEQKVLYAAHRLMKLFEVQIDPVCDEICEED